MVISAGPLTRVFTGVASHLRCIRGLPRYAKKSFSLCTSFTVVLRNSAQAMCRYTQPSSSSYRLRFVSEKLFFYLPPSALLSLLRVFAKKGGGGGRGGGRRGGEKKERRKKKKCLVGRVYLFTYHLGGNHEGEETRDNSSAFSWISWELKLESILSGSIVGNKHRTPFSLPPR